MESKGVQEHSSLALESQCKSEHLPSITYRFTTGFDPILQDLLLKMKSSEHNEVLVDSFYSAILLGLCRGGSRNSSAIYRIHSQHPIQTAPLNVYLLIRSLFCQQETVLNCQFSYISGLQKRYCQLT